MCSFISDDLFLAENVRAQQAINLEGAAIAGEWIQGYAH
jgi:hypothetical protein